MLKIRTFFNIEIFLISIIIIFLASFGLHYLYKNVEKNINTVAKIEVIHRNIHETSIAFEKFLVDDEKIFYQVISNKETKVDVLYSKLEIKRDIFILSLPQLNRDSVEYIISEKRKCLSNINKALNRNIKLSNYSYRDSIPVTNLTIKKKLFKTTSSVDTTFKNYEKINIRSLKNGIIKSEIDKNSIIVKNVNRNIELNLRLKELVYKSINEYNISKTNELNSYSKSLNKTFLNYTIIVTISIILFLLVVFRLIYDINKKIKSENRNKGFINSLLGIIKKD